MGNVVRGVRSRGKAGEVTTPEGETVFFVCFPFVFLLYLVFPRCFYSDLIQIKGNILDAFIFFFQPPGTEDVMLVVLQDYPSNGVSEPTYRLGEKLRLIAQYDFFFFFHL